MKPQFDVFQTQDYVQSFVNAICEIDLKRRRGLGSTFVRFMAIQGIRGEKKFLFILAHAQYDGYSLQSLSGTLASIYDGVNSLPSPAPLRQFISYNASRKADSFEYWKRRLQGLSGPTWSTSIFTDDMYSSTPFENELQS